MTGFLRESELLEFPRRAERSVVLAGRRAEEDPLDLGGRAATEAQGRLEALVAELARVQRPAQLVQRRQLLLGDLLAGRLDQHQVAGPLQGRGDPHERLA